MAQWHGITPTQNTLIDILDKVLDKGLVVAGDIRVSLANVELLTVKVRLLVCSIDKAQQIGLDWWRNDDYLSSGASKQTDVLLARIEALEQRLLAATAQGAPQAVEARPRRARVPAERAQPLRRAAEGKAAGGRGRTGASKKAARGSPRTKAPREKPVKGD